MDGEVEALLRQGAERPVAALMRGAVRRMGRMLESRRERRRRARARASMMPMRLHLLHDLGMVEADARRLGLLG